MSKDIVPELVKKEPWMTDELQEKVLLLAESGKISCAHAQRFAHDQSIELNKMRLLLDACGIRIKDCQLDCF